MIEKLLQLLRLALTLLACCGYLRACMRAFRLRAELALPVSLSAIGLVMLLGGVLGVLVPTVWLLLAVGLGLAALSVVRRESLRGLKTPGMVFFCACAVFFFLLLHGSRLSHIDNYSHWGAILKLIEGGDALPAHNRLVYFPAYPTGSSLLIYFFVKSAGIHAEWYWAWSQSLLLAACAAPLLCFAEGAGKRPLRLCLTGLSLLCALACLCGNTDLTDLLVDTLVPMLGLAGALLCLRERERLQKLAAPLTVLAAYLPMIKNSGWFFAGLLVILALSLGPKGGKRLKAPGSMLLGMLAANRLWAWHVRTAFENGLNSYHAVSLQRFRTAFGEKSAEDLRGITLAVVRATVREGRLVWLLLAAAAVLLICLAGRDRCLRRLSLGACAAWLLYLVSLLGMYFFSMSVGEALHAAAFDRYYRIITVFLTGWLWALTLLALPGLAETRRLPAAIAVCALLLGLCAPHPAYLMRQSRRVDDSLALRMEFDALIKAYNIPPEQGYLVLTSPEHEILGRVMCTYLLWPTNTVVCTEPEGLAGARGGMDYYIVLDETEAARALLKELGTDAPCGWLG